MKNFPMTWDSWRDGVRGAYEFVEAIEKRRAAGLAINSEDQALELIFKQVVDKYHLSGRRKEPRHTRRTLARKSSRGEK